MSEPGKVVGGKSLQQIIDQQRRIMTAIMKVPEWYNDKRLVNRMEKARAIAGRYQNNMVNDAFNRGQIDYVVDSVGGGYSVINGNRQSYINSGRANIPVSRAIYTTNQPRMSNQRAWELAGERSQNTTQTGTWSRDYRPRRKNNR